MAITLNGTTGISGADGSASTPALQGSDTNTGMFFPAADTVAIATGGVARVTTDASGNVDGKPVYQGVDTSFLVATLTAAIQELKSELDSVKAELAALKSA